MKFIVFLLLTFYLATENLAVAQNTTQLDGKYRAAVNDYKQQRYAAAMEKLAPVTSINATSPVNSYAHYYYALAAYQLKKYKESKQMLTQLISRYPGWAKINEAYYLMAAINLENGQIKEGLDYIQKIKDSSFSKDVQALKQHHIGAIGDLSRLKELNRQYPQDRDIALTLIRYIENSAASTQTDLQVADQLERQFKISEKEKVAIVENVPKRSFPRQESKSTKGYLDVSVLLPFRLDEFNTGKSRSNQFAYDYYLGLTIAKEQLQKEGINVNLWAYDLVNDAKSAEEIIANKNFQQSDLVVGPLYANTFDVTAEYIAGASTFMINPLSTDANLLRSPNIYLAHPSIVFQTQKAAQWMKIAAPGTLAAIYYGSTAKDSSMAFSYASEWKSKGGTVVEMLKISSEREWLEEKLSPFDTIKPSHVALFSTESGVGSKVLEVLNGRKLNAVPVVATSASFNLQQSRLSRFGSRLYLIETDYVDREKENIRQFQRVYWDKTSTFPSVYSYQGYDQLLFFSRMLYNNKGDISKGLEAKKYTEEDYLLSGFNYTKSKENQITPVLKFNGSKWVPVN